MISICHLKGRPICIFTFTSHSRPREVIVLGDLEGFFTTI